MSGRRPAPLVALARVTRDFSDPGSSPALAGIDLEIGRGEFIAIVGASGAGKSTLLNVLGLLDSPTAGSYRFDGTETTGLSEREREALRARRIGFVFQDAHMLVRETVGQNTSLGLSVTRVPPAERPGIVARALETVGMLHKAQHTAGSLSGGERQRVALARAIVTGPELVLADEPTGALDGRNSRQVIAMLRVLNRSGTTVVLITHDAQVARAADRIVTVRDGTLTGDERIRHPADDCGGLVGRGAGGVSVLSSPSSWSTPTPSLESPAQSFGSRLRERVAKAVSQHSVHAVRAALLLAAFSIGAGGLIAALGFGESAAAQVNDRLEASGLATFMVTTDAPLAAINPELGLEPGASAIEAGREARARILRLPGVTAVGVLADHPTDVDLARFDPEAVRRQPIPRTRLFFADETSLRMRGVHVGERGHDTGLFPRDERIPAVLLGREVAVQLGYAASAPGDQIWLDGTLVAVAGIVSDSGSEPRFETAIIGNPALADTRGTSAPTLLIGTEPGAPARLAPMIGQTISPGDPKLFRPEVVADLVGLKQRVAADLVTLIGALSSVLLALSALSAGVTAYLSVHARAPEIALRRAVGEGRGSVALQFVLEGLTVGLLGGVIGSGLGVIVLVCATLALGWVPTFSGGFLPIGIAAGAATGILAFVFPAVVASRREPALAIRGA